MNAGAGHVGHVIAFPVMDLEQPWAGPYPPRRAVGAHRVCPAGRAVQDAGEVLAPFGDAVGHEDLEQLVDAVDGEVSRDRRDRLADAEFGVDAVDDRLLRHPPDPEAHGLVRCAG